MLVIGLTGGIASGKSTVADMFRALGVPVVDADQLARQAVAPASPVLAQIAKVFGSSYLSADGSLDRKALGQLIFSDPAAREQLNQLVHPEVRRLAKQRIDELRQAGYAWILYEAALLVETGIHRDFDGLIVVSVPEKLQLERLLMRENLSEREARERLASQAPLADKLAAATWAVDNSNSVEQTRTQVVQLHQGITKIAADSKK